MQCTVCTYVIHNAFVSFRTPHKYHLTFYIFLFFLFYKLKWFTVIKKDARVRACILSMPFRMWFVCFFFLFSSLSVALFFDFLLFGDFSNTHTMKCLVFFFFLAGNYNSNDKRARNYTEPGRMIAIAFTSVARNTK